MRTADMALAGTITREGNDLTEMKEDMMTEKGGDQITDEDISETRDRLSPQNQPTLHPLSQYSRALRVQS